MTHTFKTVKQKKELKTLLSLQALKPYYIIPIFETLKPLKTLIHDSHGYNLKRLETLLSLQPLKHCNL